MTAWAEHGPLPGVVGRAVEHEQMSGLLGSAPLVTLTGGPGVGKSVLARAVLDEHTAQRGGTVIRVACWDGLTEGGLLDALLRAAGLPDAAHRDTARALAHRTAHPCVSKPARGRTGRADDRGPASPPPLPGGRAALAALGTYCRQQRATVLLDDCDPVLDECAQLVGRLLRAAPGLRIVATARHALGLAESGWYGSRRCR
ncbi:AAA family ATPase [Streptomyces lydicus]|nr:AAA family ATPase [Streptomyces lydicus]